MVMYLHKKIVSYLHNLYTYVYICTRIADYLFDNNLPGYVSEGQDTNMRLPRSHVSSLLRLPTHFLYLPHVMQKYPQGNPLRLASPHLQVQCNPHIFPIKSEVHT
jgi:hypothetical protein